MHPSDLSLFLDQLIRNRVKLSTMIWGPPGIGKSSIVAQTARQHRIGFVDLRLSQLAPTDLRGLPVANARKQMARWFPPEFLPREGAGILFLDEINLAPPTMQGMAQQLILDRRVGSYEVPDGWFIWAAGNRKEDRATVFDMPAPLANRFIHLEVAPDLDSFKAYAYQQRMQEHVVAFVSYRPSLLHRMEPQHPAWPSPRSWAMASQLLDAGLDIGPAVGIGAATEFKAFVSVYEQLPDLAAILAGDIEGQPFPDEPSARYASVVGLVARAKNADEAFNAYRWLARHASPEWLQLCTVDLNKRMRRNKKESARLRDLVDADMEVKTAIESSLSLVEGDEDARIQTFATQS